MKKKLGPLPVWGWAAAVALGVLIFYWQRHNGSGTGMTSALNPQPQLDPTQGSFDMPAGLSSGGLSPDPSFGSNAGYNPSLATELADVQSLLAFLPSASVPGDPQPATSGAQEVTDVAGILQTLRDSGLIPPPSSSTGAATSKAQTHTAPKPVVERAVNNQKGNPRQGETYRIEVNPHGHLHGTYHIYGSGSKAKYIRVSK